MWQRRGNSYVFLKMEKVISFLSKCAPPDATICPHSTDFSENCKRSCRIDSWSQRWDTQEGRRPWNDGKGRRGGLYALHSPDVAANI